MQFDLQPTLENDLIQIVPLKETDFEALYAVASDPLIWEQHPNKDRYQRAVFQALSNRKAHLLFTKKKLAKLWEVRDIMILMKKTV